MNKPKLTSRQLEQGGEVTDALENLKLNLQFLIANERLQAEIKKAKYDALVLQGFTEAQAIELCKS